MLQRPSTEDARILQGGLTISSARSHLTFFLSSLLSLREHIVPILFVVTSFIIHLDTLFYVIESTTIGSGFGTSVGVESGVIYILVCGTGIFFILYITG